MPIAKAREAIFKKGLRARALIHTYQLENPTHGYRKIGKALNMLPSTVCYHIKIMKEESCK